MKLTAFQALAAASATGLVAMRVAEAFTPYNEGDIAGFAPDEAKKLFDAKLLTLPDGVKAQAVENDDDDKPRARAVAVEDVEIPDDWEAAHYLKNRALASRIKGEKIDGKDAVADVIRAEVARRAEAAGA